MSDNLTHGSSERKDRSAAQDRDPRVAKTSEVGSLPDTKEGRDGGPGTSAAQPHGYDPEARRRANHTLVSALLALWDMVPEERFGQFVMNLSREDGGFADTWEWKHGAWLERINARHAEILEARDAAK